MKILRLDLAGFGPYKNEQHVDFERFDEDGIFLIMGRTGAGKSSILDAICYALYGRVPRYDGTAQSLRSDHCALDDPTFVQLEFRVNGTDYRVRRSPEYDRPKRRGSGTTKEAATVELFVLEGAGWRGVAAREVDVAHHLDDIVGLTKDQFLQVILLAQNRFQKFLRSNNDERQAVLRTLFGTRRFEQVETALADRRKTLEAELAESRAQATSLASRAAEILRLETEPPSADVEWFETALSDLDDALADATRKTAGAEERVATADAAHRARSDARTLQVRRDAAVQRLSALEEERPSIERDRVTVAEASRAASVWPHVVRARIAAEAVEHALHAETRAREAYSAFDEATAPADTLGDTVDRLTRELGGLESAIEDERQLSLLEHDIAEAKTALAEATSTLDDASSRVDDLPRRIDAETTAFLDAQLRASAETSSAERVERVAAALSAATKAVTVDRAHNDALLAEKRASTALSAAATRLDGLLERRLGGYAAELAQQLVDGEPCAVCGSVAHPSPSAHDGAPVTEADIDDARDAATDRRSDMDAAHDAARRLATELADLRARSGGKTVAQLESDLMAAQSALANAESARTEVAARNAELVRLKRNLERAIAELDRQREEKEAAARRVAERKSARKAVRARLARARGTFESVSARIDFLTGHLSAAVAVVEASTEVRTRRLAASEADAALTEHRTEHQFADNDSVASARRDKSGIASLEVRIRDHDRAVSTASATLVEEGMAELPSEPIDTHATLAALHAARRDRDAARDTRTALAERATSFRALVDSVRALHARSAGRHQEYTQLRELAAAVQGLEPNTKRMRLETYVLAAQLEEIVAAANARLGTMTHGRFALEHDDGVQYRNSRSGLGLSILDQHTGRSRATHSLSGGETFLASLALALGLAEVVQNQAGGITLDTLFIDEGFGSLDSETLETAMSTLDGLRTGGRTIGLISHVDTMKEQIAAKLRVTVSDAGHSEISTTYDLPEVGYVSGSGGRASHGSLDRPAASGTDSVDDDAERLVGARSGS
ncbi:AAA family ATPase [Planctomonas psychrotolerans]|uniref:AAA family ATPase n=1 Tax=Planctomonas psychrotolerans TaxID=2528712 RepID=UPI00123B5522|nr:AAA family ATPase [Planctomonas psychrotolerans]